MVLEILKIKRHFAQHREELSEPVDGKNCLRDLESCVLRGALTQTGHHLN